MTYNQIHHESKGFKKQILFPDVIVTLFMAGQLLKLNDENRPLKPSVVKKYVAEMKAGTWHFSGDVIQISTEGKLLNGQHRLEAIVLAELPQKFHVQTGLAPETFMTMDIGKLRSAGDTLAIKGYTNTAIVSSITRYVTMYKKGKLAEMLDSRDTKFTNAQIAEAVEKLNQTRLVEAATAGAKYYARARFVGSNTAAILYYIFSEKSDEDTETFFHLLSTGDGLGDKNQPAIFYLREKLINAMGSGNKISLKHKFALIIKGWNLFRTKSRNKRIAWKEDETFPVPV